MKKNILFLLALCSIITACSFPRPEPATTEMEIDVNSSEWATMSEREKDMKISDFDVVD